MTSYIDANVVSLQERKSVRNWPALQKRLAAKSGLAFWRDVALSFTSHIIHMQNPRTIQ
eukprot:c38806_g1_i1 orf=319-495(-)